ncbi:hypothetical protein CGZ92_00385 [Parenemella sanctibonifatiensis]|uniref:GrpB family protein n=1 Tax=Parenemella sanctibonifatiensis TaxID=2016505 RepID=A0A255EJ31_9ACTN|nr:hypothetical protein CGZ92_00385 [Parenemella sanctibonifatiensis]
MVLAPSNHQPWTQLAATMALRISEHLDSARVEHIGSTAVPGLPARPVVDLAVGVEAGQIAYAAAELARHGFDLEGQRPAHAWLSHPDRSARSFVIHVCEFDGPEWQRRLRFRDILIADEHQRAKYLAVKRSAAATTHDWGEYTAAKASVVAEILASADEPR